MDTFWITLISVHIFRILGVFFILLYGYHLLPAKFAFAAGLGDIITAILALPVRQSEEAINELLEADTIVISVPAYSSISIPP